MNQPISTLIIGLGGSGAWTAVHVKKQLMDMYHNEMPDNVGIAVIDTAKRPIAKLPPIELEPFEYAHIGGGSYDLVKKIRDTDEYPHLKTWFLADDYLRTLGQDLFNLDQGAGQFRQFGRLALFRDVIAPAQSSIAAIVDRRLNAIARKTNANSPSILVMVVGSLTGGTGAGLFLDIPHLIRRVAMQSRINIVLRAFLFLPDAFASTLSRSELAYAEPRAFAAMRELNRFLLNEDYAYGYPIYYHGENSGSDSTIWRAKTEGHLYDFVFLIDGKGTQRLNTRNLADGAAAVVAEAIMTYIGPQYGPFQTRQYANIKALQSLEQQRTGRRAYVSALGAYSVMMPIQQIVKGWAYELGREVIYDLVQPAPEKLDEQGHIRALSMTNNLERSESSPSQETERLMTTSTEVTDPNDVEGGRRIAPTPLWRFLYQLDQERHNQNPEKLVRHLESYDLESWLRQLTPPPLSADQKTRQVVGETLAILEDQVAYRIETSDRRKSAGNPADDYADIAKSAEQYIDLQLGQANTDGTRQGGQYNAALRRFSDYQLDRFRNYLAAYVMGTLNGVEARDRTAAKIGKLGWLMAVLHDMRDVFASTHKLLEAVRQGTEGQTRRHEVQWARDDALENMRVTAGKSNRFLGKHPGIEGQITFLRAVQEYVDFHRTQFARDSISLTARRVRDFLDSTLRELETWAEVLATGNHSLYTELVDGGRTVKSERLKAQIVVNHRMINDEEWELERFERYKEDGRAREKLFEAWQWKTGLSTDTHGDMILDITVTLTGQPYRKDQRGEAAKSNLQIILDFCQTFFYSAIEKENLMQYLMEREFLDNPRGLAKELTEKAGYLLDISMNTATAGIIPRNVLLTNYDRTRPEQVRYVQEVMNGIAAHHGQGTKSEDTSTLFQTVEGDDPFRVTLLSTADMIPLQDIQAYLRYRAGYLKLPWDARQQTHVFPAEVHAVHYEEQLTRLEQSRRILSHRVVLLLEDEQTFLEFLLLMTHKIIVRRKDETNRQRAEFLWLLETPFERREDRGRMKEWHLTQASDDPPLLEAAITYCLMGDDVRSLRDKGFTQPIPYDHLLKYLEQAQKEDVAKRIEKDTLAIIPDPNSEGYSFDEDLRGMVEAFMPPLGENEEPDYSQWTKQAENDFLEVAIQVVRHDMLLDMAHYLENQLPDLKAKFDTATRGERHAAVAELQEFYDFASVAVLVLQNEQARLRDVIENLYEVKTGQRRREHKRTAFYEIDQIETTPYRDPFIEDFDQAEIRPNTKTIYVGLRLPLDTYYWTVDRIEDIWIGLSTDFVTGLETLEIPEGAQEIGLIIHGDHINLIGETYLSLSTSLSSARRLQGYGTWPGDGLVQVDIFVDGERILSSLELHIPIVIDPSAKPDYASLPDPAHPDDLNNYQSDLTIRIYARALYKDEALIRFFGIAYSPFSDLQLVEDGSGYQLGFRDVPATLLDIIHRRLERLVQTRPAPKQASLELSSIGRLLWAKVMPPKLDVVYQRIAKTNKEGRRLSGVHSVLFLIDEFPSLPYELAVPREHHLCDEFEVTRWVEGLGQYRRTSFPLGEIKTIYDADIRSALPEFEPMHRVGKSGRYDAKTIEEAVSEPSVTGIHIVGAAIGLRGKATSVSVQTDVMDWQLYMRNQAEALRSRTPLIGLATQTNNYSNSLADYSIPHQYIRSGAAALVGMWWGVKPREDQVFWRAFYQELEQLRSFGVALQKGRLAVRRISDHPLDWLAYYGIGDSAAEAYQVVEAQGMLTIRCLEAEGHEKLTMQVGKPYHFRVTLTQKHPPEYKGRRVLIRPWTEGPNQLRVDDLASKCRLTSQILTSMEQKPNEVAWEFTLVPESEGKTALLIECIRADGSLFAEETIALRIAIDEQQPALVVKPLHKSSAVHSVVLNLRESGYYLIGKQRKPYGSSRPDIIQLNRLVEDTILKIHSDRNALPEISQQITATIKKLLGDTIFEELSNRDHLSLVDDDVRLPWEYAAIADNYWGIQYAIGHLLESMEVEGESINLRKIVSVGVAETNPLFSEIRAFGHGIENVDGTPDLLQYRRQSQAEAKLSELQKHKRAHLLHIKAGAQGNPKDLRARLLKLGLPQNQMLEIKGFQYGEEERILPVLNGYPLVFLDIHQPEDFSTPMRVTHFAYSFLQMRAKAVIAPLFAMPKQFAEEFALAFYSRLLTAKSEQTLGEIMMETRLFLKENPLSPAYLLFGNPQLQIRRP